MSWLHKDVPRHLTRNAFQRLSRFPPKPAHVRHCISVARQCTVSRSVAQSDPFRACLLVCPSSGFSSPLNPLWFGGSQSPRAASFLLLSQSPVLVLATGLPHGDRNDPVVLMPRRLAQPTTAIWTHDPACVRARPPLLSLVLSYRLLIQTHSHSERPSPVSEELLYSCFCRTF